MNIRKFLKEATADGVTENGIYKEIMYTDDTHPFTNQDYSDFLKMSDLRFIADARTEKLYVFDSNLLHYRAAATLSIPYPNKASEVDKVIYGEANWNKTLSKLEYTQSFTSEMARSFAKSMNDWLDAFMLMVGIDKDGNKKDIYKFTDKYFNPKYSLTKANNSLIKELSGRIEERVASRKAKKAGKAAKKGINNENKKIT